MMGYVYYIFVVLTQIISVFYRHHLISYLLEYNSPSTLVLVPVLNKLYLQFFTMKKSSKHLLTIN